MSMIVMACNSIMSALGVTGSLILILAILVIGFILKKLVKTAFLVEVLIAVFHFGWPAIQMVVAKK